MGKYRAKIMMKLLLSITNYYIMRYKDYNNF